MLAPMALSVRLEIEEDSILPKYNAFLGGRIENSFLFTSVKFILTPMFMEVIISDSLISEDIRKPGWQNQQKEGNTVIKNLNCVQVLVAASCFRPSWPYLGLLNYSLNALTHRWLSLLSRNLGRIWSKELGRKKMKS